MCLQKFAGLTLDIRHVLIFPVLALLSINILGFVVVVVFNLFIDMHRI